MNELTERLWRGQNRHPGDRERLFRAVRREVGEIPVLYAGSYVDVAASFAFDSVTYVDTDKRAARFFADREGVAEIVGRHRGDQATWAFIQSDYEEPLDLDEGSFGLLVSLYAGLVSGSCTRYLRRGGWLLANSSHGDVALASINPEYRLAAVITSRGGEYTVRKDDLDGYLIPKRPTVLTKDLVRSQGRGIAYSKSPFAYLFQHVEADR